MAVNQSVEDGMGGSTRWLFWGGIVGPIGFVAAATILGAITPGYDPARHFVSLLGLGTNGWLQVANFVVAGALIAAFGAGLRRVAAAQHEGPWESRLVIAVGVGLAAAGLIPSDPALGYPPGTPPGLPTSASWHAGLHYLAAVVVFVGLPAATFVAALRDRRGGLGGRAAHGVASGPVVPLRRAAPFALVGPLASIEIAGFLQRVAIVAGFQWLVARAAGVLATRAAAGGSEPVVQPAEAR